MMRAIASLAAQTDRAHGSSRRQLSPPCSSRSESVIDMLDFYRDTRDQLVEQTFHAVAGSAIVQAACGIPEWRIALAAPGLCLDQ
jgi:hypothetical protein